MNRIKRFVVGGLAAYGALTLIGGPQGKKLADKLEKVNEALKEK